MSVCVSGMRAVITGPQYPLTPYSICSALLIISLRSLENHRFYQQLSLSTDSISRGNSDLATVLFSFYSISVKNSFTFFTSVNSFPFSTFPRHGNLLSHFPIADMFFSISFSSFCSSLILKPNSTFSCWSPMFSTTTLTSFRNTSTPFS